jgi:hypothetical protein
LWLGIDVSDAHRACAVDENRKVVFFRRVANDQADIEALSSRATGAVTEVRWAVDLAPEVAGLLLALLSAASARVVFVPGRMVNKSLPGLGPVLGAEFLAATGANPTPFTTPAGLATYAGLAPAPRDSGRVRGNLHRPQRYNRAPRRVFFMAALCTTVTQGPSRFFYQRKRA